MNATKILLLGYMGSGKSAVGSLLCDQINFIFRDLDNFIEIELNESIPSIFKNRGEIYFRKKEREFLERIIENPNPMIVSLGGGTPCYYNNMEYISELIHVKTVYLQTSVANLSDRLYNSKNKRPLIDHLNSKDDIMKFVAKHLFERNNFYNQSNHTVNTDNKTVVQVVEDVVRVLA
jgi:shikimate kinase